MIADTRTTRPLPTIFREKLDHLPSNPLYEEVTTTAPDKTNLPQRILVPFANAAYLSAALPRALQMAAPDCELVLLRVQGVDDLVFEEPLFSVMRGVQAQCQQQGVRFICETAACPMEEAIASFSEEHEIDFVLRPEKVTA